MRVMGWRSSLSPWRLFRAEGLGVEPVAMQCFVCCGLVRKGAPPCRWNSADLWGVGFSFRSGADLAVGCRGIRPSSPTAPLSSLLESSRDLPLFCQWRDWLLLRGGLVVGGGDGLRAAARMGKEPCNPKLGTSLPQTGCEPRVEGDPCPPITSEDSGF